MESTHSPETRGPPSDANDAHAMNEEQRDSDAIHNLKATKKAKVLSACDDHDLSTLIQYASSTYGFVDDGTRRKAWPLLLGCSQSNSSLDSNKWRALPKHPDEHQVALDVNRSFVYYPSEDTEKQLDHRKQELSDLITQTIRTFPYLSYFQGYHDIVQVLLLVLGRNAAAPAVARLSLLRLRDFMLTNMAPSMDHLRLIPPILRAADPALAGHIAGVQPFFALPATLTLYAHEIQEYGDIARLFDFLLAREASMSIYLFVVTVLERKDEILEYGPEEQDIIHAILSKLPKPLDVEKLIAKTVRLYEKYPPENLPTKPWRRISPHSVLKTSHNPQVVAQQTLADGEKHFFQQERQLKRILLVEATRTTLWKYRRPGALALTVLIGVLSWWIRRDSPVSIVYTLLARFRASFGVS